jgi:AcrR family transcriptional regulator
LNAAERAIRRFGVDATMTQVAAEAGLTKPALYASFPNKGALADALAERIAVELAREIVARVAESRPLREALRGSIDVFCSFAERDPQLYRFLVQGAAGLGRDAKDRRLAIAVGQLTTFGLRTILERTGTDAGPAATWAQATIGALFYTLDWWVQTKAISRALLVDHLTDAAWAVLTSAGIDRFRGPLIASDQASLLIELFTAGEKGAPRDDPRTV